MHCLGEILELIENNIIIIVINIYLHDILGPVNTPHG